MILLSFELVMDLTYLNKGLQWTDGMIKMLRMSCFVKVEWLFLKTYEACSPSNWDVFTVGHLIEFACQVSCLAYPFCALLLIEVWIVVKIPHEGLSQISCWNEYIPIKRNRCFHYLEKGIVITE